MNRAVQEAMRASCVAWALAAVSGCASMSAVAVDGVAGRVLITHDRSLTDCDLANPKQCKAAVTLGFVPTAAVFTDDHALWFLDHARVYRCDASGGGCVALSLPFEGQNLAATVSSQVVVVSGGGVLATCSSSSCQ